MGKNNKNKNRDKSKYNKNKNKNKKETNAKINNNINNINSTLCLNMIVKNETKTLPSLFKSLYEIIDYYVILDTGSTDGTPDLIKSEMNKYNINGEIHHTEWTNFGECRDKALKLAIGKSDYIFVIDADEELVYKDKNYFKNLKKDCYYILRKYNKIEYYLPAIINIKNNNRLGWCWKGVVHNYLEANIKNIMYENIDHNNIHIISHFHGGSKSHNITSEEKYLRDAKLLEEELKKNPNDTRSQFYLAQSYRDAKIIDKAIENYKKRLDMNGWIEEIYYSKLSIGRLMIEKGNDFYEFLPYLLDAYKTLPRRLESIYTIVHYCRTMKMYSLGYLFGKAVVNLRYTNSILFIEQNIYDYALLDEYSICAYWTGNYRESKRCCDILLSENKIPENYRSRINENLQYALNKLNQIEKKK